jgi:hypothetical protein
MGFKFFRKSSLHLTFQKAEIDETCCFSRRNGVFNRSLLFYKTLIKLIFALFHFFCMMTT